VVVRQLRPELADGLLGQAQLQAFLRPIAPPVRWLRDVGPLAAGGGRLVVHTARLVRPQGGSDRYWVIRTGGRVEAEIIGAALGAMLRAPVQAQDVLAFNPATRTDEPGVMACVPADCARALRDMPPAARRVYAHGDCFAIDPVTSIGQRGHGLRRPRVAADELRRTVWSGRSAPGSEAAIVVATAPADATGRPVEAEETARVLPAAGTGNAASSQPSWIHQDGTVQYMHPMAQAPCWLRLAPEGDEPAPAPAATEALAVAAPGRNRTWQALPAAQRLELDIPPGGAIYALLQGGGKVEIAGAGEVGRIGLPGAAYVGLHNPAEAETKGARLDCTPNLRVTCSHGPTGPNDTG